MAGRAELAQDPETETEPEVEDEDEADAEGREETQVTALLSGMKEVMFEQVASVRDMGGKADRVSRIARRPKSVQNMRAVSVPPEHAE